MGQHQLVLTLPIENILITELTLFMRFMREVSQVPFPILPTLHSYAVKSQPSNW
jgi:hypothetical protein